MHILFLTSQISFRKTDKNDRPSFNQVAYCLDHKDDQILGSRRKMERTRSITFSYDSETYEHDEENCVESRTEWMKNYMHHKWIRIQSWKRKKTTTLLKHRRSRNDISYFYTNRLHRCSQELRNKVVNK